MEKSKSINGRKKPGHTEWAQSWLCFYGCGKTPQPKQHKKGFLWLMDPEV